MRPILFRWGAVVVYSYPAMLYTGLVLGLGAGNYAANAAGIDSVLVFAATLALIIPALAGARLLFVVLNREAFRNGRRSIWRRSGGAAMFGGLPPALILSVPLLRVLGLPFGVFWDVATFTILVGMVVTRIGCLLHGCCAGRPTTGWISLRLPDHRGVWQRRVPCPLLECGCAGVLLVGAVLLWQRLPFPGALFLVVASGYGVIRMPLESARERLDRSAIDLRVHRLVPMAVSAVSLLLLFLAS